MSQVFHFSPPRTAADTGGSVVSIDCLRGSSTADEWAGHLPQTGDIVEELAVDGDPEPIKSPFKKGAAGVQKILRKAYKNKETSVVVRVRRWRSEFTELQACIVPDESNTKKKKKQQYVLRAIGDPNYAFGFSDRTVTDCRRLQASRKSRMVDEACSSTLEDGYVPYDWKKKMQETLPVPNSSSFLSILFLPKASEDRAAASRYCDLEETLARTNVWLNASQNSGVPIVFMNIQTESLLTKISGETASCRVTAGSLLELGGIASSSLYGFEDYHGVDIGVVRAIRLWYAPSGGELSIEIDIRDGDSKLGFSLSRTDEGFIYISAIDECDPNTPAIRSGLLDLYKEATRSSKLLVVSRVSNQKILPWQVSSVGAIRCYDVVSLSQKLSLHRRAKVAILLHLFSWETSLFNDPILVGSPSFRLDDNRPLEIAAPGSVRDGGKSRLHHHQAELFPDGDEVGEVSLRFHDLQVSDEWLRH